MSSELFDQVAADYDSWYETPLGLTVDKAERKLAERMFKPSGIRVLEVGCGTGQYTIWLARQGYEITAVDISQEMMARAQAKMLDIGVKVDWLQADISKILPNLGKFHGIFSLTAFEFIPNPEQVLQGLFKHLEPGGCLMIGVIAGGSPWGDFYTTAAKENLDSVFAHAKFYTEEQIKSWQIGGELEIGKALFFPPIVDSVEKALEMESQEDGNPGFFTAMWVKSKY